VKAVFFDAGGTLIHMDFARLAQVLHDVLGRNVSVDQFIAAEYLGRAAIEAHMASGEIGTDTTRWKVHFRAMLEGVGVTEAEFDRVTPVMMEEHKRKHLWCGVFPGTADGLADLKTAGYFVAVISNADGTVAKLLDDAGILPHLEFVIDSSIVGVEKPERRIFELALEKARETIPELKAEECFYVGDIYPIDVVGSRGAGMVPVLVDPLRRYGTRDCRTITNVAAFCHELVSALRPA
jgi:putative hydrolase of the HAD superfamily